MYTTGEAGKVDLTKAAEYFTKAAEKGLFEEESIVSSMCSHQLSSALISSRVLSSTFLCSHQLSCALKILLL